MESTERRFPLMLFLYKIAGLPLQRRKLSFLQSVYDIAVSLSCYSVYLASIYYGYINIGNMGGGVESTCHLIVMLSILVLEVNHRFQRRTIERLLEHVESFTWEDMPLRDVETGEVTMAGYVPKIKTIAKGLVPFLYGVHITQSCVRVILYRELMYDTLYPFDTYSYPFYELVFLTQVIAMLRISLFFIGAPYFYAAFICIGCTQLEKVKYLLLQMKQNTSGPEKEEFEDCNKRNEDFTLQKKLNDVVRLHQQVISYIRYLEEYTCLLLGGVLFLILLLQCATAYAAATMSMENLNDFSRAVYLYLIVTWIACVYCGYGTMLSEEYESVGNAVFASDWVGTPVRYQTCISFMIAMSNQGFSLTAAKFAPVSNATLMNMINESMSLFMFFLTMKDKND